MSEPPQQPPYGAYPGGYPPPPPHYGGYPPPAPKNGLGTASLVVAIISLFTVFGGIVLGVVAVILGFLGRGRVKRGEATNGGIAMAGIIPTLISPTCMEPPFPLQQPVRLAYNSAIIERGLTPLARECPCGRWVEVA